MQTNAKIVQVTNVYRRIERARAGTVISAGGSGSSKTYSHMQFFLFKRLLTMRNLEICVLRKTRASNKQSVYKDFIKMLREYNLYDDSCDNKTELIYRIPSTNSYIWFGGLDQRSRIKSTQWHEIYLEEANEFSKEDYWFLQTRLYRGQMQKGFRPRIWMSFNPEDCWIFDYEGKQDVDFLYSNYKDNNFANKESIERLEGLKYQDDTYYKIYTLGQRAKPKGLIYNPYIMEKEFPKEFDEIFYGLDFGYNNPTALIAICIKDDEYYLKEMLYETKLTNADLIEKLKDLIPDDRRERFIFADDEDPNRIEEISEAGFNIHGAKKKLVISRIDLCKRKRFHTLDSNTNLNKERSRYKWKVDKNGNVLDKLEPVNFFNHAMDAKGYGVWGYTRMIADNTVGIDII